jgi:alpha/beta superfamily hydrolase
MTPSTETEIVEGLRFASGSLQLEGRLCYPESGEVYGAVALAGPHPMLGGDMDNNVVRGLSTGLARAGLVVLSFNYRGVGGSDGTSPDVTADLAEFWRTSRTPDEEHYSHDFRAAVTEFAALVRTTLPRALVGYSFGCSLLGGAAISADWPLVLIAPTIGQHDYQPLTRVPNPILAIAPDEDFAAEADRVGDWFASLTGPRQLIRGDWDTHFFRGHEQRLCETVFAFLTEQWEVTR